MSSGADKTERATPKRREDARRRGQVAKSQDLNGALVLLAGLLALSLLGPHVVGIMESTLRDGLASISRPQELMSAAGLGELFSATARAVLLGLAPIAAVCVVAGVVANVGQSGIKPATQALTPDPRRLNPINGARNIFGTRMFFEGAKSLAKVGVVGAIVALALIPRLTELSATVGASPAALSAQLISMVFALAQRAALAYLVIAAIDYGYQRWRHEKSLRMSMEELREELKSHSLPAEVKGAQRRRQLQQARARMMAAVPHADVVVVNPTHFAVALKYDGSKPAPECVAKGQDLIALQIRRLAEQAGVPVIEDRPLARSLHASIEVGQLVPEELFQAVAQVLAYVYRVARRRSA
ncbi:MAG TPA: EscU/YscU/HrcU family type III secretion system export apparatus switch protein [Conexibacter sp.]|nr:EscU/YscU/HrcU family type III secretion system export apparatus switch protein [Conexibacter sp.]